MADLSVIRKRADFVAANRGLRVARPGFVLLAHPNGGQGKRYGVTVTKKIGNAVVRNRMKRRFRELLRAALPNLGLADHDHILLGREGGIERDFAVMRDELVAALSRAASSISTTIILFSREERSLSAGLTLPRTTPAR